VRHRTPLAGSRTATPHGRRPPIPCSCSAVAAHSRSPTRCAPTTGLLLLATACGGGGSDAESVDKDALIDKVTAGYFGGQNPAPDCIRGELEKLSNEELTELGAIEDVTSDPPQIQAITTTCVGTEAPVDAVTVTDAG
jgi:hypothetical protein